MLTIWKFKLKIEDRQFLAVPEGAIFLQVQIQEDSITDRDVDLNTVPLCLWAIVDESLVHKLVEREIEIIGTGNRVDSVVRQYLGTVQRYGVVLHVFERVGIHSVERHL